MSAGILMAARLFHKTSFAAATALSLLLASEAFATADAEGLEQQRIAFQNARAALHRGDLSGYRRLEPGLKDYALYPYLRHDELRKRLAQAKPEEVRAFFADYPDTPVAGQLRRAWLAQLARRGNWSLFVEDYAAELKDDELRCLYANALVQTGNTDLAWNEIENLWLSPRSQPDECNAPFTAWRKADQMTREKVLARMELAIERSQGGLVSHLTDYLPKQDKPWVARWQRVHRSPAAELRHLLTDAGDAEWRGKLFAYGVRRLAGQDAEAAAGFWEDRGQYEMTPDQSLRAERAVALNLAMQRHPEGHRRLAALATNALEGDRDVRHWRVRSALWQQDWEAVLAAVDGLNGMEQASEDWQYWRARALESLGREREAEVFYRLAAQHRSFYGFLAAGRLGRSPNIVSEPLAVTEAERSAMEQSAPMVRIRELNRLGMTTDARREWRDALDHMDDRQLCSAAALAHEWGWYDQAILALGRSKYLDDLEVRFPTPFLDEVHRAAERRKLDPAFVYAVMRQESAFGVQARSPVGALGLMQLMPATAKRTARSIKERAPSRADLLTAEKNIRIGTAYLSELLDKYRGNRFFALAAYNAGPQRVARWQPRNEPVPADIWVANVTFAETREYVERILAYTAVYEWRLGRSVTPVSDWLADAPPRQLREASNEDKDGALASNHGG